jgi:hypothetical protein
MSALFSATFSFIFVAFIVAALIGHALLIEAVLRPFFASLAKGRSPAPTSPELVIR